MEKEVKQIASPMYEKFFKLVNGAFPGMNAEMWLKDYVNETPNETLYGLFDKEKLLAGMRVFDFEMNFADTTIPVGGVGMLAVDMLHKKEGNAFQLMKAFMHMNKEKGVNLVMLYPFNVSFYKKMGFGMGTQIYQFYLSPNSFRNYHLKEHLVRLDEEDRRLVMDCYNRVYKKTHGMTKRIPTERELNRPFNFGIVVGFKRNQQLEGYLTYDTAGSDLIIHELFFETSDAIKAFSTFLHQQADQFKRVIINSNHDDLLHFVHAPESDMNPMIDTVPSVDNKHVANQGVGVMYRVLNTRGFFEELHNKNHLFGKVSLPVKFEVDDDLQTDESKNVTVTFLEGKIKEITNQPSDVVVKIGISAFSSLVMGAVTFKTLHKWGEVEISRSEYVNQIQQLFLMDEKPVCTKAF
ncbi:GNAT family N-acetyltransferase [Virgibacillus flavescens]|uniref:GNAT family N-acetyltransferase n=1 Tax=Virgibacillus flavescens TaxID=1611422 RepID=UPI003D32D4AC